MHIVGPATMDSMHVIKYEELMHTLPELKRLSVAFVGPDANVHGLEEDFRCPDCMKKRRCAGLSTYTSCSRRRPLPCSSAVWRGFGCRLASTASLALRSLPRTSVEGSVGGILNSSLPLCFCLLSAMGRCDCPEALAPTNGRELRRSHLETTQGARACERLRMPGIQKCALTCKINQTERSNSAG